MTRSARGTRPVTRMRGPVRRSDRCRRFADRAARTVAAGARARFLRVRLLFRTGSRSVAARPRAPHRIKAGGTMTIGGDSSSGARPLPVSFGPRADAAPMTMALATQMLPLVAPHCGRPARGVGSVARRGHAVRHRAGGVRRRHGFAARAHRTARCEARAADVDALRQELVPLGANCRSPRSGRVEWLDGGGWHPRAAALATWRGSPSRDGKAARRTPCSTSKKLDEDDPSRSDQRRSIALDASARYTTGAVSSASNGISISRPSRAAIVARNTDCACLTSSPGSRE